MKKFLVFLCVGMLTCGIAGSTSALSLYVDAAPNVYGSPDWTPWWEQTKQDVASDSFTNMRTGTFPGTTTIDPYDEIVYSTGDLGKRLHWIYWLPGESTQNLAGLFEVKWVIDWGGTAWTYDNGSWAVDAQEVGWSQPTKWEDYYDGATSGVIGSLGFAWWATDNDAEPIDTGGSPYDETNQADIDALRELVFEAQTYAIGMVRYRVTEQDEWEYTTLQVNIVPEPSTMLLLGSGLIGIFAMARKKYIRK